MRFTLNIFASFVFLLSWVGTGCALCHGLSEPKAKSAADQPVDISADGANHVDMSDYTLKGSNGGRGGLPAVKLWLKKSQIGSMKEGDHSWNYPDTIRPDNMHYASWEFWRFWLSDALLQLISEQATNPHALAPELGRYFFTMTNSGATCWSKTPSAPTGLEVDISDETPVNESCRSDHYITYGVTNQLFFSGSARFLLTVDKNRRLTVKLLSSTLPPSATANLAAGISSLDRHPVLSFPDGSADHGKVQLVAEFILKRKPGLLKKADHSSQIHLQSGQ